MTTALDILAVFAAGLGVGYVLTSIAAQKQLEDAEWRIDNLSADCESNEAAIEELCRQRDEDWAKESWPGGLS